MSNPLFSFTVTVARQNNALMPQNEKEAARLIGMLLEQGEFLEVLDIRKFESIVIGKEVA